MDSAALLLYAEATAFLLWSNPNLPNRSLAVIFTPTVNVLWIVDLCSVGSIESHGLGPYLFQLGSYGQCMYVGQSQKRSTILIYDSTYLSVLFTSTWSVNRTSVVREYLSCELLSRSRWRIICAQLKNKFGYCPLRIVFIVLTFHKHNNLLLWADLSLHLLPQKSSIV